MKIQFNEHGHPITTLESLNSLSEWRRFNVGLQLKEQYDAQVNSSERILYNELHDIWWKKSNNY